MTEIAFVVVGALSMFVGFWFAQKSGSQRICERLVDHNREMEQTILKQNDRLTKLLRAGDLHTYVEIERASQGIMPDTSGTQAEIQAAALESDFNDLERKLAEEFSRTNGVM